MLFVDNFAGGGGASLGIEWATGRSPDIAINHDAEALAMHEANHPDTRHFREDVWSVDPVEVTDGKAVGVAWFSPDCKHFSKAKGSVPVDKQIRGLAWVAVHWAKTVRPRVIFLENVEEFTTWGPVGKDGRPCPRRKGREFRAFVSEFRRLGYRVETRELRACDHGAPTTRRRFFLIARCDGRAIRWPEPTHGDPASEEVQAGKLLPWRTAAECIGSDLGAPAPTVTSRDRLGIVTVHGVDYAIWDIGLRMLQPRELFLAQGFPASYIIVPLVGGKPLTKTAQVRMVGNSVCPPLAAALVWANCSHMAVPGHVWDERMAA